MPQRKSQSAEVSVNTTVRVEIALASGELEESVIVTGEAPMLQTSVQFP